MAASAPTLKRLSMFVLRAKCKLTDASADLPLFGLAGADAAAWLGDAAPTTAWASTAVGAGQVVRLPDVQGTPRWLLAQPASAAAPDLPALAARLPQLQAIAHNGGESARAMRVTAALGLPVHRLPSSSPANASWSFERKLAAWSAVFRQHGLA